MRTKVCNSQDDASIVPGRCKVVSPVDELLSAYHGHDDFHDDDDGDDDDDDVCFLQETVCAIYGRGDDDDDDGIDARENDARYEIAKVMGSDGDVFRFLESVCECAIAPWQVIFAS